MQLDFEPLLTQLMQPYPINGVKIVGFRVVHTRSLPLSGVLLIMI